MKSARECMDVVNAYLELGSYRATAERCGTTHKTVRRISSDGGPGSSADPRSARTGAETPTV